MQAIRFYWGATKATFGVLAITNLVTGAIAAFRMKKHPRGLPPHWQAWNVFVLSTGKSIAYAIMWPTMLTRMLMGDNPFVLTEDNLVKGTFL